VYHTSWPSGSPTVKTLLQKNQVQLIGLLAHLIFWQQNLLPEGQVYDRCPANIPNLRQQIQQCIKAIPNYFLRVCQAECKRAEVAMAATEVT
jgi:hypothetical protein